MTPDELRAYKRNYIKIWRIKNPEKRRQYKRIWYSRNKEKAKAKVAAWREKNPDKVKLLRKRRKPSDREGCLKKKYGLSLNEWNKLFNKQGCCCAICHTPDPMSKNGWHTDHDHKTKRVRGILCHNCNRLLGGAKDSITILKAAIEFLDKNTPDSRSGVFKYQAEVPSRVSSSKASLA